MADHFFKFMFFPFFRDFSCDVHVLQACHVYLSILKEQSSPSISSNQNLAAVFQCVQKNLASHARLLRLLTLKILTIFEQPEAPTQACGKF